MKNLSWGQILQVSKLVVRTFMPSDSSSADIWIGHKSIYFLVLPPSCLAFREHGIPSDSNIQTISQRKVLEYSEVVGDLHHWLSPNIVSWKGYLLAVVQACLADVSLLSPTVADGLRFGRVK